MEASIGIIGGSGLYEIDGFSDIREIRLATPFGEPSDSYIVGHLAGRKVAFLPRHGVGHRFLPHEINYRANIFGFKQLGLTGELATELVVTHKSATVPSQLIDQDNDGNVDALLFIADFSPAESKEFIISRASQATALVKKRTQAEVSVKTGGSWQDKTYLGGSFINVDEVVTPPQYTDHSKYIRFEGPGIESDKIGYRVYLDWRNGFDIFGKTENKLTLQNVGQDGYESYHKPASWGMDIIKVGKAPGIGGLGYWEGKRIQGVADVEKRSVKINDNGPLQSSFTLNYKNWKVTDLKTDLAAKLSMQAGSRLVHVELSSSNKLPSIATTIVKHPEAELITGDLNISGHAWTYVANWGAQSVEKENLGMYLFFRKNSQKQLTEDKKNIISVLRPRKGAIDYYFGGAWSKENNGITNKKQFIEYLNKEAEKLTMPLRVKLRTKFTSSKLPKSLSAKSVLNFSSQLADSEIQRLAGNLSLGGFAPYKGAAAKWSYTTGLLMQALDDLSLATGNNHYAEYARNTIDSYISDEGIIKTYKSKSFNIDSINSGKMLLRLLERTGDNKYKYAVQSLVNQLKNHPRTSEGAFWHKKRYPWQLWLDGVYMGMPFVAHHANIHKDSTGLEEATNEFLIAHKRLYDPMTGLYYHGWDEHKQQTWADPKSGLSSHFWSRGIGWYAMALVDVLDYIPDDRSDLRDPIVTIIDMLATTLVKHRSKNGIWYQVTDKPEAIGNYPEASGSSMFVYMLAKAVNKGYIANDYKTVAINAYASMLQEFVNIDADGAVSINNICRVSGLGFGRDGSYKYYMSEPVVSNDPKGLGPFIMAGIQVSQLFEK